MSTSRQRASGTASGQPSSVAVSRARARSEVSTDTGASAAAHAASARAWLRPSSERGGSAWPCSSPRAFHAGLAVADEDQAGWS